MIYISEHKNYITVDLGSSIIFFYEDKVLHMYVYPPAGEILTPP